MAFTVEPRRWSVDAGSWRHRKHPYWSGYRVPRTPTCIYLANRGLKAANVPIVPNINLPPVFETLNGDTGPLVVGLTTDPVVSSRCAEIDFDFSSRREYGLCRSGNGTRRSSDGTSAVWRTRLASYRCYTAVHRRDGCNHSPDFSIGIESAMPDAKIVLASASQSRAALLKGAGLDVLIHPSDIDRTVIKDECRRNNINVATTAARLARGKSEKYRNCFRRLCYWRRPDARLWRRMVG